MSRFKQPATHAVVIILGVALILQSWIARSPGHPDRPVQRAKSDGSSRAPSEGTGGSGPRHRAPITYQVAPNDTLDSVAARFKVTAEQVRWSNPQRLATSSEVEPGQTLVIPPVAGVVVTVRRGDTLPGLAARWHVGRSTILGYNALRDPNHDVRPGKLLVLPGARGPGLADSRTPPPALPMTEKGSSPPFNVGGPNPGGSSYDGFPSGQCTYYVASRVNIPWNGDAGTWFQSAQSGGWPVGPTPRQGAVMVTWENELYGHVAYVEHAYSDGSWLVSEMNYTGEGVIDQRLIRPGAVPLAGFIYPPRSLGR